MAAAKRSGHARLKAALVLRDALAAELGISLTAAMTRAKKPLRTTLAAAHGLTDGGIWKAISSVGTGMPLIYRDWMAR